MSRKDENIEIMKIIASKTKTRGTYDELVVNNLGTIGSLLADISKSLAIIADALDEGRTE